MTERAAYIGRIRNLARSVAQAYYGIARASWFPDGPARVGGRSSEESCRSMSTKNLLVELFVEELPPKALNKLGEAFSTTLVESLKAKVWLPPSLGQKRSPHHAVWRCMWLMSLQSRRQTDHAETDAGEHRARRQRRADSG